MVFDDNRTIDDVSDDKWRMFRGGQGNGNLPSSDVLSIAKDRSGFIWVGTSNGIAVIQCIDQVFSGCQAFLPVIQEGGISNYLFNAGSKTLLFVVLIFHLIIPMQEKGS